MLALLRRLAFVPSKCQPPMVSEFLGSPLCDACASNRPCEVVFGFPQVDGSDALDSWVRPPRSALECWHQGGFQGGAIDVASVVGLMAFV